MIFIINVFLELVRTASPVSCLFYDLTNNFKKSNPEVVYYSPLCDHCIRYYIKYISNSYVRMLFKCPQKIIFILDQI